MHLKVSDLLHVVQNKRLNHLQQTINTKPIYVSGNYRFKECKYLPG